MSEIINLNNVSYISIYKKIENTDFKHQVIKKRRYLLFGKVYEQHRWVIDNMKLDIHELNQILGEDCSLENNIVYYKPTVTFYMNCGKEINLFFIDDEDAKEYVATVTSEMIEKKIPVKII